ncbi:MAG: EamA family transporter [Nodosilinea sp.]
MGPLDHLPADSSSQPGSTPAEVILRSLSQDLDDLRQRVSGQLSEDIAYLQAHKQRLMADIEALETDFEALQAQHRQLQTDQAQGLSQQQLVQQQVWAKRLAQALATHLQTHLEAAIPARPPSDGIDPAPTLAAANQRLAALDVTLHSTLQSLQQDLNSYQSSLSQQVSRMHSIEQQGEAILAALVARLSQQLQTEMVRPQPLATASNGHGAVQLPPSYPPASASPFAATEGNGQATRFSSSLHPTVGPPSPPADLRPGPSGVTSSPAPSVPQASVPQTSASFSTPRSTPVQAAGSPVNLKMGLVFVVLSTLALSMHNVLVGIMGYGGQLLGQIPVAGVFPLTISNSLMLLWLRMAVVVPLMALGAVRLYPSVWLDIEALFKAADKRPAVQVVASGGFLFLSQVLIYKAISDVGPGVAVTLLFMYPLITVPLTWFLFRERPTPLRLVVMFAISMGIVFTALPKIYSDLSGDSVSLWGIGAALLSSAAFALYLVAMQLSFRRLHPVPVSLLQFCTIFVLTSLILIIGSLFGLGPDEPTSRLGLYGGGLLLGLLTLLGYLCNNYGVKLMGAAQASIIAASGPVLTAILAYLITPGEKSSLLFIQWMGVLLVTLGVVSLSLERLTSQHRHARRPGPTPL